MPIKILHLIRLLVGADTAPILYFIWRYWIIRNYPTKRPVKDEDMINEKIRFSEVMLIDADGAQLGNMSAREAQNIAYDQDLDLVCVAPNAKPPVCKVMDYRKHKFEQQKKARMAKKNQTATELKELRLSPTIDIGDFNTKLKNAQKFLNAGHKLKLSIRFRGRMIVHKEIGMEVMLRFADECKDIADIVQRPKMDGRSMHMMLEPKKK